MAVNIFCINNKTKTLHFNAQFKSHSEVELIRKAQRSSLFHYSTRCRDLYYIALITKKEETKNQLDTQGSLL